MEKRTLILAGVSFSILASALAYRFIGSQNTEVIANVSDIPTGKIPITENVIRTPERGHISDSIDALARKIVESAPNQEEAYTFLVEAKSYRIQELRNRRAQERAAEEKARYDAELWNRKRGQIDVELAKEAENSSINTQAGRQSAYINEDVNQSSFQRVDADFKDVRDAALSDFMLRAIIKDGDTYMARLSYKERAMPAKAGYTLLGKIKVLSVNASQVVLKKNDDTVTLYAY
ncbi:hypothetical protein G3489_19690 [Shewanella baltica]|uniref:hypothetical protein n=1 Tax=Shewanella baltica TaxID=62322 RepID=UPI00217E7C85|nr:hypothetical protein [Shewanella baltica]MCS6271901.1 hypothetical protein [Shewanella baltica]